MANFKYSENKKIYQINELVFKGENFIKNSPYISSIIMPPDSLLDTRNLNRITQYQRLVDQASFVNYPQTALSNVLGITNRGQAEILLPPVMQSLKDYATKQNVALQVVQDQLITSIFKYGLAGLKVSISNDVSTIQPPRVQVIEGIKILDGKSTRIGNVELFDFVLIDASDRFFNEKTKSYNKINRYKILGIDAEGEYYQALIQASDWQKFNLKYPSNSEYLQLVYPEFYEKLNFIPFVAVNAKTCELKWSETSFIQNLINLSLNIFKLDAQLKQGLYMQANGFLAIYGSNLKPSEVIQGMYAVNVLKDSGAKMEYITPNHSGIQLQKQVLENMRAEAMTYIYSIVNAGENASGESIKLRLQFTTTSLVGLVKNVGNAITRALEYIATIMDENIDQVDYKPFIDFTVLNEEKELQNSFQQINT